MLGFPRLCPMWIRHHLRLRPRRNRLAPPRLLHVQPRSPLNRSHSRVSGRRIKILPHPSAMSVFSLDSGFSLSRTSSFGFCFGVVTVLCRVFSDSGGLLLFFCPCSWVRVKPQPHSKIMLGFRLPPTPRPRGVQRQATRRQRNPKRPHAPKSRNHPLAKTWCFQQRRFGTVWLKTFVWKGRSLHSTTTVILMWIASMRWWPTTTAAAEASAIAVARWKAPDGKSSSTGANFSLKVGADSLAPPLACYQHLRSRLCRPYRPLPYMPHRVRNRRVQPTMACHKMPV